MNKSSQLLCAHSALLFVVLLSLGFFVVTGWLPLVKPSATATEVAQMFIRDQTRIRIGITLLATGSVLWWGFSAAIATQMKRIEGLHHPLTYVQLASASGTVLAIIVPCYFWLAISYRPEALAPATLQLINDFGWLSFIGAFPPGALQCIAIGICVLADKTIQPVYPRWVGYLNIWVAISFLPGALLPFFKTGPFAWNGIIGFWLVAFAFFGWILLMWWMTVQAIKNQTAG